MARQKDQIEEKNRAVARRPDPSATSSGPKPRGKVSSPDVTSSTVSIGPLPADDHATVDAALATPPRRSDRIGPWPALLMCLAAACPTLLIGIQLPYATEADEARSVATSIQTWRHYGELTKADRFSIERYEPYLNGRSQLRRPPGLTWVHMAVFGNTADNTTTVDQLVTRARLVSVGAALLTVASVFWAAYSIGRLTTAVLAVLVCIANPMFIYYGRLATTAIAATAMGCLCVAAALWAIRPLRPAPSVERQFLGWLVCGLSMGAAVVTRGLWVLPELVFVIVLLLILCPNRISHLLGLLAALLIAVLIVAPWGVYAHEHDIEAWRHWLTTTPASETWLDAQQLWNQGSHRFLLVASALLPWTIWVVAAFIQPFSTSSKGSRTRLFLGTVWFGALLALTLSQPGLYKLPYVLPLLPAAAVAVGQLFSQYASLADEGRSARMWRLLRWPQLVLLAAASGAIPAMLYGQQSLLDRGLPRNFTILPPPPWPSAAGLCIVLIAIVFLSLRWALKEYPRRTHVAWAAWTLVLVTTLAYPAAESHGTRRGLTAELLRGTEQTPLFWLHQGTIEVDEAIPNPFVLLYAGRDEVRPITPAQLLDLTQKSDSFCIVSESDAVVGEHVQLLREQPQLGLAVWRYAGRDRQKSNDEES